MSIDVRIVNALTDAKVGGNPAGVVLDADALDARQKLEIARRVGLSETAFVSKSEIATIKLEFFTPSRQIAHCGHATIATFALLSALKRVNDGWLTKETIDGIRNVLVDDNLVLMEQRAPTYRPIEAGSRLAESIAGSVGLAPAELFHIAPPTVVNTGNAFLLIALPERRTVAGIVPNHALIEAVSDELDLIGYYAFSTAATMPGRHATARMFAPRFGIAEESATGTAAGPLACFLRERIGMQASEFVIEQGQLMEPKSPSAIQVRLELDDGRVSRLMAGGEAVIARSLTVEL